MKISVRAGETKYKKNYFYNFRRNVSWTCVWFPTPFTVQPLHPIPPPPPPTLITWSERLDCHNNTAQNLLQTTIYYNNIYRPNGVRSRSMAAAVTTHISRLPPWTRGGGGGNSGWPWALFLFIYSILHSKSDIVNLIMRMMIINVTSYRHVMIVSQYCTVLNNNIK